MPSFQSRCGADIRGDGEGGGALGGALPDRGKRRHARPFLAAQDKSEASRSRGGRCDCALRGQRLTGKHIAMQTGVSEATVGRVLAHAGLLRLKDLVPAEPARRYEGERQANQPVPGSGALLG